MKRIFRMILFSAAAIFFTALWNKGFIMPGTVGLFITSVLALACIIYIIIPISKVILLPFNILTFGLISFVVFLLIFHFSTLYYHFFEIKAWQFREWYIPYWFNLVLSSLSISSIINLLEQLL